jgi:hypothetical protein
MATSYRHFFDWNTIIEEDDGALLHHRLLLLLKHIEEGNGNDR